VLEAFARFGERTTSQPGTTAHVPKFDGQVYNSSSTDQIEWGYGDTGTAARFFFSAKAASWEREGNHPTVKPVALMEWLVSLVTPPGGAVIDPFCGTGSTLVACDWLGIEATGIELDPKTCADAERKVKRLRARRIRGEVERHEPLPGQLELF
jgi:DNA modification methylase